tara:strand:- start:2745 stop:2990 length:246 start_codon:yes stop_codon:yes gene_type:complete
MLFMKKDSTTEVLSELHAGLAHLFMERLKEGTLGTAELNILRQFLKDNQISAQPSEGSEFGELAKSLPDIENVINLKKRRA